MRRENESTRNRSGDATGLLQGSEEFSASTSDMSWNQHSSVLFRGSSVSSSGSMNLSSSFLEKINHDSCSSALGGTRPIAIIDTANIRRSRRISQAMTSQDNGSQLILESARDRQRARKEVEIAANKLRFHSLRICGREKEKEVLAEVLQRSSASQQRELVVVKGLSGSGKTSLVSTMRNKVKRIGGSYASGKFSVHSDAPFSAIAEACREICGAIQNLAIADREAFRRIRLLLCERLDAEICLLSAIFPELTEILDHDSFTVPADLKGEIENGQTKHRLHLAFRTFFKIVSENVPPLVIVLDDMQWADQASLELFHALATDIDNNKIVFICTYRSEEVGDDHPFLQLVNDLENDGQVVGVKTTEIELGSLTVDAVNEMLMELLSCEVPERTLELAALCHRRTLGNAYFVLGLVRNLRDEQFLVYHPGSCQWHWDIQAIRDDTSATKNVVELMKRDIERFSIAVRKRLVCAACLSTTFKPSMLNLVWGDISHLKWGENEEETDDDDDHDDEEWLDLAVKGGFIEPLDSSAKTVYQWIHDSVREAVLELVPPGALWRYKKALGNSLLRRLDKEELELMVFVVSSLVHEGHRSGDGAPPEDDVSAMALRVDYCHLNLEAALKARKLAAFDTAARYAARGIDLLPPDRWRSLYQLTLSLYTVAAESEMAIGNSELVQLHYEEVIAQEDRPLVDKLPVYTIMLYSYHSNENLDCNDGIELGLAVLGELGISFPKSPVRRIVYLLLGLSRWRKKGLSMTSEEISTLPSMDIPIDQSRMRLLNILSALSLRSEKHMPLCFLAMYKMLSLTFEKGISDYSPQAFGILGIAFSGILGDFELGNKMAAFAEHMIHRMSSKLIVACVLATITTYVRLWVKPIANNLVPFMRGYKAGLSVGDTDFALICVSQILVGSFVAGHPLPQIESDCRVYGNQAREFKRNVALNQITICWLGMVKLMGDVCVPFVGTEPSTSMDELPKKLYGEEKIDLAFVDGMKSVLHAIFGENLQGAKLSMKNENPYARYNPGHFFTMQETFSRCLCLYAMARQTKSCKYKRHARKVHRVVKKWRSKGNPNVIHHDILLDAEEAALRGEYDAAETLYQKAKTIASRSGLTLDAAQCAERYGEFLIKARRNNLEAAHKFSDAIALYDELGAKAKAEQLREGQFRNLSSVPE